MTPITLLRRELARLQDFHLELRDVDDHQYVTGWGVCKFARTKIEREIVALAREIGKLEQQAREKAEKTQAAGTTGTTPP